LLHALPNGIEYIGAGGDVGQALVGLGILDNGGCFAFNRQHCGALGLLDLLKHFGRMAAEAGEGLDVFLEVQHGERFASISAPLSVPRRRPGGGSSAGARLGDRRHKEEFLGEYVRQRKR
jgi:hypothetical protein